MNDAIKRKAAFLDRDGTINVDKGYFYRPEELEFEEGAIEAICLLRESGYLIIVISNQAGIGIGHFTEENVDFLHEWMNKELAQKGGWIDGFYYCPHHKEYGMGKYKTACSCRKPEPGLILQAAHEWNIDLETSYMVGDHNSDVEAGLRVGVTPIFVRTGHGNHEEKKVAADVRKADNLYAAVKEYILCQADNGGKHNAEGV